MSNRLYKNLIPITDGEFTTPILPGEPGYPGFPAWDEIIDRDVIGVIGWYPNPDYDPGQPISRANRPTWPIIGTIHVHEVIHHDAIPAVLGDNIRPPVALEYNFGWNATAIARFACFDNAQYRFSIKPSSIGLFTGWFEARNDDSEAAQHIPPIYPLLDYAFRFDGDQFWIYELGVPATGAPATFAASDVFTLRRLGVEVAYYKNSVLIYRSTRTSFGYLLTWADLFAGGDEIFDAELLTSVDAAYAEGAPASIAITVPTPFRMSMSDVNDAFMVVAVPVPTWQIGSDGDLAIAVPVPSVKIMGADYAGITVAVPMPTVSMQGDGFVEPTYGVLTARVPMPSVAMYGNAADYPALAITVPAPKVLLWSGSDGIVQVRVPMPSVYMYDAGSFNMIEATMPRMTASIDGQVLPNYFNQGIRATMPKMTALMYGGGRVRATMPKMTAALTATTSNHFALAATLPSMTAALTAYAGSVVTIAATMPRMTAVAYGSGRIVATMPAMTAALTGQSGTVVAVAATMPRMTGAVTGFAGRAMTIAATMPRMVALSGSYITATMPRMRALITANESSYEVTEAYAVTLNNENRPVTRFTNYPFHSIVRIGARTIGFGPDGARELRGDDDAGDLIAWAFTFGATDELPGTGFGQGVEKINDGAYFTGRFENEIELSVAVDDGETYSYIEVPPTTSMDTIRIPVGRGLCGFKWQFGLAGTGMMKLYRCEFLQRSLRRKVKHG